MGNDHDVLVPSLYFGLLCLSGTLGYTSKQRFTQSKAFDDGRSRAENLPCCASYLDRVRKPNQIDMKVR